MPPMDCPIRLNQEVVLISVPYGALPQLGHDLAKELAGKVVLDTGNPYPERDGEMALEARRIRTLCSRFRTRR